jgi:hypothetical protein
MLLSSPYSSKPVLSYEQVFYSSSTPELESFGFGDTRVVLGCSSGSGESLWRRLPFPVFELSIDNNDDDDDDGMVDPFQFGYSIQFASYGMDLPQHSLVMRSQISLSLSNSTYYVLPLFCFSKNVVCWLLLFELF